MAYQKYVETNNEAKNFGPLVAGRGLARLVMAAACHSKEMKVALFEQASS